MIQSKNSLLQTLLQTLLQANPFGKQSCDVTQSGANRTAETKGPGENENSLDLVSPLFLSPFFSHATATESGPQQVITVIHTFERLEEFHFEWFRFAKSSSSFQVCSAL